MKLQKITTDSLSTRAGLAKAITWVESKRADHQQNARDLLSEVMDKTGKAIRIGITGVPGVGKSTFIDNFGSLLTSMGHKVAVLAVDPTSRRSGGSILGDKTRMDQLSVDQNAFIRPSPAGDTLGGVARKTRETLLMCEAAGYDIILVETVGVGQSETVVADMVDLFLVLMLPNAGDELQGIKKGVLEVADIIAVNKCDIDEKAALRAARHYKNALHIMTPADPSWLPPVATISGESGIGLEQLWETIKKHETTTKQSGSHHKRRSEQQLRWMDSLISDSLMTAFTHHSGVEAILEDVKNRVAKGQLPASKAADLLMAKFRD
ncbi:methylmalonyl Co-A mutase-associated GTPase MeaB [Hirschia maritima]|uniref:methylmalonyl Co-A mutase-associated GTPase MeaB n=1 Tax=Hirschia maritima TaxID=1121961 RepID=UPI000377E6D6|nr:methylmalonyl Co-A mutase-associated GTPase MeaB [Hirschia maritima]